MHRTAHKVLTSLMARLDTEDDQSGPSGEAFGQAKFSNWTKTSLRQELRTVAKVHDENFVRDPLILTCV